MSTPPLPFLSLSVVGRKTILGWLHHELSREQEGGGGGGCMIPFLQSCCPPAWDHIAHGARTWGTGASCGHVQGSSTTGENGCTALLPHHLPAPRLARGPMISWPAQDCPLPHHGWKRAGSCYVPGAWGGQPARAILLPHCHPAPWDWREG